MAAILNLAILDSAILDSALLVFPLKLESHLPGLVPTICTKITFTHSFWLNLMMAAILNSTVVGLRKLLSFILTQLDDGSHLEFYCCWIMKTSLIHSDSTWWCQPSWILLCWIQTPCFLFSDSLKNTLPPLWLLTQTNSMWLKLIHSHSTWWWQPSWNSAILNLAILVFPLKLTHTCQDWFPPSCKKKNLHSHIVTQLDDGSHLEFPPCWIQTLPSRIQTPS